jgi:aerobic carbon-monoxide dehydrogenase medium subunit
VKPASFAYHAPGTIEDALRLLHAHTGEVRLIAGGQSLVPAMNFRLARPAHLVDINGIEGLAEIRERNGRIEIGALARHQVLADSGLLRRRNPLLAAAAATIGYPAIRSRGTIGGSLAHADPAAQWPLLAILFDAEIALRSERGTRKQAARDFFLAPFTTAAEPDEILTSVAFPALEADEGWGHRWVWRRQGDFAVVAAAATVVRDPSGRPKRIRVAVGGAEPSPSNHDERTGPYLGRPFGAESVAALANEISEALQPMQDHRGSAEYRRELAAVLVGRALQACLEGTPQS